MIYQFIFYFAFIFYKTPDILLHRENTKYNFPRVNTVRLLSTLKYVSNIK